MPSRPRQRKSESSEAVSSRTLTPRVQDPDQFWLFDDPMPDWIAPCKPRLVKQPPIGEAWTHEIKWDGYRISAYLRDGAVTIRTSSGLDFSKRFPAIAAEIAVLPAQSAIIDGEAVVIDEHGRARFGDLQAALTRGGAHQAILYAFDLLYYDGLDMRAWPLDNRRTVLEGLIAGAGNALRFSEALDAPGADVFRIACAHGLEGVVSKRRDRPYLSGDSHDWLKAKCILEASFVIIGYQPGARGGLGAIHVAEDVHFSALERGGKKGQGTAALRYAGSVGTGFSDKAARELQARLDALSQPKPAIVGLKIKGAVWCRPEVRAEVAYRDITREGLLRHASFKATLSRP